jgi:hypothetical protein
MLLKQRPLRRQSWLGGSRLYTAANGPRDITLGVLPLSRFLNGHTYFVQHAHTLPDAAAPLAVHMTYQFAGARPAPPARWCAGDGPRVRGAVRGQRAPSSRMASGSGYATPGCGSSTTSHTTTAGTSRPLHSTRLDSTTLRFTSRRYLKLADDAATLQPTTPLAPFTTHSKDAIERHLAEARHRSKLLRNLCVPRRLHAPA